MKARLKRLPIHWLACAQMVLTQEHGGASAPLISTMSCMVRSRGLKALWFLVLDNSRMQCRRGVESGSDGVDTYKSSMWR
jgi:hypothetical protein